MEIIQGTTHRAFPVSDPSCVGEARRHVAHLSRTLGFDEVLAGQAAIAVNELGNNLCRHAQRGQLWIATRSGDAPELEILSVDEGPGIADLPQAMRDGYSTGGTPGTGLGAVERLSADFDIHSEPGKGTVVLARFRPATTQSAQQRAFRVSVMAVPAPGETVCGDAWALALDGPRAALLVADGLGHGVRAAEASQAAVEVFLKQPFGDIKAGLEDAHAALRMTRGAAVTYVQLDGEAGTLLAAGAGNVAIRLVSGVYNRSVLVQHGTVGVQMRQVQDIRMDWPAHAMVVCHSDGLQSRWPPEAVTALLGRDPGLAVAVLVRDYGRGRDDVTVLIVRRTE